MKWSKKKIIIVAVTSVVVLSVLGVGGYYLYEANNRFEKEIETLKTEKENLNKEKQEAEKKISELQNKVGNNGDENKTAEEYVGLVDYIQEKNIEGYSTTERIKLPYINLKSEDAQKANSEIKELYNSLYSQFGKKDGDNTSLVSIAEYKYYKNNNILSIIISYGVGPVGPTSIGMNNYKTYNFDLGTSKFVSYETVNANYGYDANKIVNEINKKDTSESGKMEVKSNEFFINNNNELNVICTGGRNLAGEREKNIDTVVNIKLQKEIYSI